VTIDLDFSQVVVDAYRSKYWRVKQLWWDMELAAIHCVQDPRSTYVCNKVEWTVDDGFLFCTLPSGRRLAYPEPRVSMEPTPWGESRRKLSFMGVNPFNHQWQRQTTYGGSLVENVVQAIARDLMAEAMYRCEQSGVYSPVLSVHDEMISEADITAGSVLEYEELMAEVPDWGAGCPVAAEGWTGLRYRK
jgi:DNA polymerase